MFKNFTDLLRQILTTCAKGSPSAGLRSAPSRNALTGSWRRSSYRRRGN